MGIHQALIGGYSFGVEWEVLQSVGGTDFTLNNLAESNLVVFIAGDDDGTPSSGSSDLPSATNLSIVNINAGRLNSIGYRLSYAVVPSGVTSSNVDFNSDYAFTVVLRRTSGNISYSLSLKDNHQSNGSPTHNFNSVNMAADSFALLIGYQDDDTLTTVSPPPSGSSGSPQNTTTLLGYDPDNNGTVCVASQKIETSGSYAWGAWTTGPGSDFCLAQVVEIKET